MAWIAAEAAKPLEWHVIGVWLDAEEPDTWTAVAPGPTQPADMLTGHGGNVVQAPQSLPALRGVRDGTAPDLRNAFRAYVATRYTIGRAVISRQAIPTGPFSGTLEG